MKALNILIVEGMNGSSYSWKAPLFSPSSGLLSGLCPSRRRLDQTKTQKPPAATDPRP